MQSGCARQNELQKTVGVPLEGVCIIFVGG